MANQDNTQHAAIVSTAGPIAAADLEKYLFRIYKYNNDHYLAVYPVKENLNGVGLIGKYSKDYPLKIELSDTGGTSISSEYVPVNESDPAYTKDEADMTIGIATHANNGPLTTDANGFVLVNGEQLLDNNNNPICIAKVISIKIDGSGNVAIGYAKQTDVTLT